MQGISYREVQLHGLNLVGERSHLVEVLEVILTLALVTLDDPVRRRNDDVLGHKLVDAVVVHVSTQRTIRNH